MIASIRSSWDGHNIRNACISRGNSRDAADGDFNVVLHTATPTPQDVDQIDSEFPVASRSWASHVATISELSEVAHLVSLLFLRRAFMHECVCAHAHG